MLSQLIAWGNKHFLCDHWGRVLRSFHVVSSGLCTTYLYLLLILLCIHLLLWIIAVSPTTCWVLWVFLVSHQNWGLSCRPAHHTRQLALGLSNTLGPRTIPWEGAALNYVQLFPGAWNLNLSTSERRVRRKTINPIMWISVSLRSTCFFSINCSSSGKKFFRILVSLVSWNTKKRQVSGMALQPLLLQHN